MRKSEIATLRVVGVLLMLAAFAWVLMHLPNNMN